MNAICVSISIAPLIIFVSCSRTKSSNDEARNSETSATISSSSKIRVEFSSVDAINAPVYDPEAEWGVPFALMDGLIPDWKGFPIVDVGAYPEGGKMVYDILIFNQSPDTVTVESIKLPNNTMDFFWEGLTVYKPGLLGKLQLKCDSAVTMDDYRFILTYEGDKYPPQTFHINLHSDIHKLISERASK